MIVGGCATTPKPENMRFYRVNGRVIDFDTQAGLNGVEIVMRIETHSATSNGDAGDREPLGSTKDGGLIDLFYMSWNNPDPEVPSFEFTCSGYNPIIVRATQARVRYDENLEVFLVDVGTIVLHKAKNELGRPGGV